MDMRVKAGDSITLYGDCVLPLGSLIVWLRNCSHEHQPSLLIETKNLFKGTFPHFSFVLNSSSNSYDLHITNFSVSDEGIYYCAKRENKRSKDVHGIINVKSEYEYGNLTTRLSVLEPVCPGSERFNTSSTLPSSDCVLCWTLLFSVCPVCVLLFSICVYCICQRKTTDSGAETQTENRHVEVGGEVCYASLDMPSTRQKKLKRKTIQRSDFSVYSEVRANRT
ncbi:uncharacterized protein LOC132141822 isoform X2 [Carassius carassius]|uniref:uncharacterized protein LOC132141822 isoform X2 n=1 Tax=Carassius carassius TaxID=217509 RepID=UPI0028684093|nr:uncharacterized protein LOC132141822 isoform X2 [Carassius carassius]